MKIEKWIDKNKTVLEELESKRKKFLSARKRTIFILIILILLPIIGVFINLGFGILLWTYLITLPILSFVLRKNSAVKKYELESDKTLIKHF